MQQQQETRERAADTIGSAINTLPNTSSIAHEQAQESKPVGVASRGDDGDDDDDVEDKGADTRTDAPIAAESSEKDQPLSSTSNEDANSSSGWSALDPPVVPTL